MNNFWNIVGFEFKKILGKKSAIVSILVALGLTIFVCVGFMLGDFDKDGYIFETYREAEYKDRGYARALTGRPIDSELLMETAEAYQKIPITATDFEDTEEYELYARPYASIAHVVRSVLSTASKRFEFTDVQNLTSEQANTFYDLRYEVVYRTLTEDVDSMIISQNSKDKQLLLNEQIETPFIFEYTAGYARFFRQNIMGVLIFVLLSICLAPIFAGEYTARTDQLILSSKNGKRTLIYAKLFVGISLSVIISVLFAAVAYFASMLIYGSDGVTAPYQLLYPRSPYPLNMGQVALSFFAIVLCASIFIASLALLLSAWLKSSFGVIMILFLSIIVSVYIDIPETSVFLHSLANLHPTKMVVFWNNGGSFLPYELFGLFIKPYIFMPIFAALLSIVLVPFAFRGFKNHQVA